MSLSSLLKSLRKSLLLRAVHRPAGYRTRLHLEAVEDRTVPATIMTDLLDYPFGSVAAITGTGFAAGEAVTLQVTHAPGTVGSNDDPQNQPWTVTADAAGDVSSSWAVDDPDAVNATYILSATGTTSGDTATWTFTDAATALSSVSISSQSGSVVADGSSSVTYTVTVNRSGNGNLNVTLSIPAGLPAGTVYSFSPQQVHFTSNTPSLTSTLTITPVRGTLPGTSLFTVQGVDDSTPSNTRTTTGTLVVSDAAPVLVTNTGLTVAEDTSGRIDNTKLQVTDLEQTNNQLVYTITTGPSHGTLMNGVVPLVTGSTFTQANIDSGFITYQGTSNYNGSDGFWFTVSDGYGGSIGNTSFVITVTAVNDAPVLANTSTLAYTENAPATAVNTAITVTDVDNTTLASATVTLTTFASGQDVLSFANDGLTMGNIAATSNTGGVLTLTSAGATASLAQWQAALRVVKYANTSDNPTTTPRSVAFVVNDGSANSNTITSTVNITAVNDAPIVTAPSSFTVTEDTAGNLLYTGTPFFDADATTLVVRLTVPDGTITGNPGTGITVGGTTTSRTFTGTAADLNAYFTTAGKITYTPAANNTTARTLTTTVTDEFSSSSSASSTINITPVNDAPVAVADGYSTNEDTALAVPAATGVLANDTDVDTAHAQLTAVLVAGPSYAAAFALNADGSFTYTPAADYNGPDSFTYKANDGSLDSNVVTVSITVTAVNDAPVLAANAGLTVDQDTSGTIDDTMLRVTDVEQSAGQLVYTVVTGPASGTLWNGTSPMAAGGTFTQADIDANAVTYQGNPGYSGPDGFTFTVSDGAGGTIGATPFAITVTATVQNQAPTLTVASPTVTVNEGQAATNGGTFADADSPAVTVTASVGTVTQAAGANGAWSWSYTPPDGPAGSTTVTITASDGTLTTNTTFSLTVNNVAPSATFNAPAAIVVGGTITLSLTGASDPSPTDRAAGFTYAFDFGDGSGYRAFAGSNTATSAAATATGTRAVRAMIRDKDGGVREYTATVSVVPPGGLATTLTLVGGVLRFTGSGWNDTLTVSVAATGVYAFALANGGTFAAIPSGWSGLNTATATGKLPTVSTPVVLSGGVGDDVFNIRSTFNPIEVDGQAGRNVINISSNAPTNTGVLSGILNTITVDPGVDNLDSLTVADATATAGNGNVAVTPSGITGFAGSADGSNILFGAGSFASLRVIGSDSSTLAERFTINAPPTSYFRLDANSGPDAVTVTGDTAGDIYLGAGDDTFTVAPGVTFTGTVDGGTGSNVFYLAPDPLYGTVVGTVTNGKIHV